MTYQRFEDLPVWEEAARLYEQAEDLLENESFQASRAFRDQLDRAALSVSNNVAEGFDRGTTNELLQFIYDAADWQGRSRPACERGARIASVQGPQHAVPPRIGPRVNTNVNPA